MIVTGGGRGIGAATARLAAERGYAVCINYRKEADVAEKLAREIKAIAIQGDVASEADVVRLFRTVDDKLGRVSVLVNNAGIVDRGTRVEQMSAERIQRMLAVNVTGSFLCAREAVKRMSTRNGGKGGAIVNVSSLGALTGSPHAFIDYAASKGALDTATIGLAAETADCGIRVNGVRPGLIDTDIHADVGIPDRVKRFGPTMPIGRAGNPEEVAEA
ncbi:MAG TPA: SDR family oxidoreductase, partial [Burkholderiales bacterium]|nr:SDR family oxidoreductase [Burkholderiales bacterium]